MHAVGFARTTKKLAAVREGRGKKRGNYGRAVFEKKPAALTNKKGEKRMPGEERKKRSARSVQNSFHDRGNPSGRERTLSPHPGGKEWKEGGEGGKKCPSYARSFNGRKKRDPLEKEGEKEKEEQTS